MKYELVGAELVIRDDAGAAKWRGKPLGYPVNAVSPLEKDQGAVVLLDYMAGPKNFANLLRIQIDGTVAWQARPPDPSGNDAFVAFHWMATSWLRTHGPLIS